MAELPARRLQSLASRPATLVRRLGLGAATTSSTSRVPRPLEWDQFEPVDVDAGTIWISRQDQVMRPFMQKAGSWEPEEGALLRSLLRPGERFLDIGANVGYFSVLLAKAVPGITIDAVEPDPNNVRALEFNLWVNRVVARVWPRRARRHRPPPDAVRQSDELGRPPGQPDSGKRRWCVLHLN